MTQSPKPCKSCGKPIVFLLTKAGKTIPINWDSLNDTEKNFLRTAGPVEFDPARHFTHFRDCPAAKDFRKPR